ncbi:MAG: peptidoglycan endopeptidase [Pseudomonadota bacterium]
MKIIDKNPTLKSFFIMIFSLFFICMVQSVHSAEILSPQEKKEIFGNKISEIAERYIGISFGFGKDIKKVRAVDNSHLFCLIYEEAARQAGLKFAGYSPMKELLRNTVEVQRDALRNGDLIVLNNGLSAMIYKVEGRDKFFMIYASQKRAEIISFNSQNLVYEVYWQENLKGFLRLKEDMFVTDDAMK